MDGSQQVECCGGALPMCKDGCFVTKRLYRLAQELDAAKQALTSDTPRTDEALARWGLSNVFEGFVRSLERELTWAKRLTQDQADVLARYMPRYENKVAMTAEEVKEHGLRTIGDTYRIRLDPPLFGWPD